MVLIKVEVLALRWICEDTIADMYNQVYNIICNNIEVLL